MKRWHKKLPALQLRVLRWFSILFMKLQLEILGKELLVFFLYCFSLLPSFWVFWVFFFLSVLVKYEEVFFCCADFFLSRRFGAETESCWQDLIWGSFATEFTAGVKLPSACQKVNAMIVMYCWAYYMKKMLSPQMLYLVQKSSMHTR